jgi:hypothetical protein
MPNDMLPLNPQKPLPGPKRYEITIDNKKHNVVVAPTRAPAGPPNVTWVPNIQEIQGTSVREDELMEYAHNQGTVGLVMDGRGNLSRPGENQMASWPTYTGHSRVMVRRRPRLNAAALARGIVSGNVFIGNDGSVYARRGNSVMGFSPFKKVGKLAKKGVKGVSRGVKATGRGIAKGAKKTGHVIKKGLKLAIKPHIFLAKLSAKAFVGLARIIAAGAATPIKLAFRYKIGRPRANALAHSRGRKSPNNQDKREAVDWGLAQLRKVKGPKKVVAFMAYEILKFTRSRGAAMVGIAEMGSVDPATIEAIATAAAAVITALGKLINFKEGLKSSKGAAPGSAPGQDQAPDQGQAEAPDQGPPQDDSQQPMSDTPPQDGDIEPSGDDPSAQMEPPSSYDDQQMPAAAEDAQLYDQEQTYDADQDQGPGIEVDDETMGFIMDGYFGHRY